MGDPSRSNELPGLTRGGGSVRLIGVSLAPYTARHCTGLCAPPPGVLGGRPYRELPPLPPLTLQPGTTAGVTLHFRGAACGAAPHSVKEVDNRVLRVDYEADGRTGTQMLRTGGARLVVASNACAAS